MSRLPSENSAPYTTFPPDNFSRPYSEFRQRYPDWVDRGHGPDPYFAIPQQAVHCVSLGTLLTDRQIEAEQAFTQLCDQHFAIGLVQRQPLQYPCFAAPTRMITEEEGASAGWTRAQVAAVNQANSRIEEARQRLQGVAGYLTTNASFCQEVDLLRNQWTGLPTALQVAFPLRRSVPISGPVPDKSSPGVVLPVESSSFLNELDQFLDRWGLIALHGWHLPDPQGPLFPSSLPSGAPAEPQHGIRINIPLHYPLQGDDQFLQQLRELQRTEARRLQLPESMAPIRYYQQFAQILKLQHLEIVLDSRFPNRRPRGFVTALEAIAADVLAIEPSSVKRLRVAIQQLRRGESPRFMTRSQE